MAAKAKKDREMEDMADVAAVAANGDDDSVLVGDDLWLAQRETAFQTASDAAWAAMSDSDIARESMAARVLPPAPRNRPDKRSLFPQPGASEQKVLRGDTGK